MKIRMGFVSNSSSSSFLIYGTYVESSDVVKAAKKLGLIDPPEEGEDYDEDDMDRYGIGEKLANKLKVELEQPWYEDNFYFGISPEKIKDDETGAEFKARVKTALVEAFGEDIKLEYFSEAWYDG